MTDATKDVAARDFAERLRAAVEETTPAKSRRSRRHRTVVTPLSAPLANPTRVRHSDQLFVERVRRVLG